MATSSLEAARSALEAVQSAIPSMALLHGNEMLAAGSSISDLDVAIGGLPPDWDAKLIEALAEHGLRSIVTWPYDSGAVTLFLATLALRDGVQLDLLHSPRGQGKYGLLTDVALKTTELGEFGPEISRTDSWLYMLRKRALKGQRDRIVALLSEPPAVQEELLLRADELFAPGHREVVRSVLDSRQPIEHSTSLRSNLSRARFRLRHPAGIWIHIEGVDDRSQAAEVHARLGQFAIRTTLLDRRVSWGALRTWNEIVVARWRAGVVLTWGPGGRHADVRLATSTDVDDTCEAIRQIASQRAGRHLNLLQRRTSW